MPKGEKTAAYNRANAASVLARQLSQYTVSDVGCWEWTAVVDAEGYGQVRHKKRRWKAHRLSYHVRKGPIPEGLLVLHKCDNPRCINPDHLFLGTHKDNMQDKMRKKRAVCGERNWNATLTEQQVLEIRSLHGILPYSAISKQYGIGMASISNIMRRNSWKHI